MIEAYDVVDRVAGSNLRPFLRCKDMVNVNTRERALELIKDLYHFSRSTSGLIRLKSDALIDELGRFVLDDKLEGSTHDEIEESCSRCARSDQTYSSLSCITSPASGTQADVRSSPVIFDVQNPRNEPGAYARGEELHSLPLIYVRYVYDHNAKRLGEEATLEFELVEDEDNEVSLDAIVNDRVIEQILYVERHDLDLVLTTSQRVEHKFHVIKMPFDPEWVTLFPNGKKTEIEVG